MRSIVIFLMVLVQTARGFPHLTMPDAAECEKDVIIKCEGNSTTNNTYEWYFKDRSIANTEDAKSPSKYSTAVNETTSSLTIYKIDAIRDAGTYACVYGNGGNISKSLKTECKAAEIDFKIQGNKTVLISADRLYPNRATFKTSIWPESDVQNITTLQDYTTCHNSKIYPGYYRCHLQTTTAIPDGSYMYSVTVTTITDSMYFNGSFLIASPSAPVFLNTTNENGEVKLIRGNEGVDLTVKCISRGGYPCPNVVLYKNYSFLSDAVTCTLDRTYNATNEYTFKTIPRSYHGASLHCKSSYNGSESIQSTTVQLYLYLKPDKPSIYQHQEVSTGETVYIHCSTPNGRPKASIVWVYDGKYINGTDTVTDNEGKDIYTTTSWFRRTVTASDNGRTVSCNVNHPTLPKSLSASVDIQVQFPPNSSKLTTEGSFIADGSTTLNLTCTTGSSNPASDIIWTYNYKIRDNKADVYKHRGTNNGYVRSQSFILTLTRNMDGHVISCYAQYNRSKHGQSKQVVLDLKYKPIARISGPSNRNIREGEKLVLSCSAEGKPRPTFTWLHNHSPKGQDTRFVINNVSRKDYGNYTCRASNGILQDSTATVSVNIKFGSKSTTITGNKNIEADGKNELQLSCEASTSNPASAITWKFNETIKSRTRESTTNVGRYGGIKTSQILTITPTRQNDGETITCEALNNQMTEPVSHSVKLNLNYKPIIRPMEKISVIEGSNATLVCFASSKPPSLFRWYTSNRRLTRGRGTESNNSLRYTIDKVSRIDSGTYMCSAEATVSEGNSQNNTETVELEVQFGSKKASISGNKRIVADGRNKLPLSCVSSTANPASKISWKFEKTINYEMSGTSETIGMFGGIKTNQTLSITPTRHNDGQTITCQAQNNLMTEPVSKSVKLDLTYKPIIRQMKKLTVVEGSNATLVCFASSKPPSDFIWYTSDTRLIEGRGTESNNSLRYTIDKVSRNDSGTYICFAEATVSEGNSQNDRKTVELEVQYPPELYIRTKNVTINDNEAIIQCDARGVPNKYIFNDWKHVWPGTNATLRVIGNKRRNLTLTNLTYAHSGIYVCGASNGIQKFGTDIKFIEGSIYLHVKSFPIITKPAALKASSMLDPYASFEFEFFSNAGQNWIKCFKNISDWDAFNCSIEISKTLTTLQLFNTEVETDGFEARIKIHTRNEDDFGVYMIKVINAIGESTFSLHVLPNGPPCVPYNVSVDAIAETSATLSWIRCFHGGFNQTFVIQLSKDGVVWNNKTFIEGGQSMNRTPIINHLHSLVSTSVYHARMFAYNDIGRSNYSESIIFTTKSIAATSLPLVIIGGAGGGGVGLIVIIIVATVLVLKHEQNKGNIGANVKDEVSKPEDDDDNGDDIQENPMYISADLNTNAQTSGTECLYAKPQKTKMATMTSKEKLKGPQQTGDVYATVNKVQKKVSANKSSQQNENLSSKGAPKRIEQPVVPKKNINKEGLHYADVVFENLPSGKNRLVIHGEEERTSYALIDLTKHAEPLPDSEEECEDAGKK